MANEVSKIKLPNDTTEYPLQDDQAIASITRSGTTFTATRRDGTSFTFTQRDNNTTYTFATGDNNGQIKVTPSGDAAQNVSVKGLGAAAYKGTTTSVTSGSSDLVTSGAVYTAIDNLPEPMIFKGSLGTGGTITTLPTASSANEGYTYKVITAGTYASQAAKVGDLFISNSTDWIWIPSGDEPSGTVTSITLKATSPIAIDSSSAITTSGTRTLSHANSGVTAGTYRSVTVNATGHVTAGTNPTTLSGYGITDAKIANGVITLGSSTITPLTSHQTVTDNNPTLAWGTKSKVATIGGTAINVTMPANPNTNTTYTIGTSGNNITLTPSSGNTQSITAPYATDAGYLRDSVTATTKLRYINSNDATTWTADTLAATDSIAVIRNSVTGAWATGHIVTFNVNTVGTPFQLGVHDSNELYFYKRYKSGGTYGDWVKMNAGYADSAGSATKATQDGSGNTITSTYVKKSGDTMTGTLTLYKEGTTNDNYPTELKFQNKDTTTGKTSNGYIRAYDGGESGANIVINPAGNIFIGSGEAAQHHYDLYTHSTSENFFATADSNMYLQANGQTIANRVGISITSGHALIPVKADVGVNNVGSIGTSSYRWNEIHSRSIYSTRENQLITGSGTAAQDKGAGVSPRYFPAKWTFNTGLTVADGDVFTIKIPVAGHSYGVYMSVNNGSNYYPIVLNGTGRLTTHYPVNTYITVVFESSGSATSIYPVSGGDATTTVTGGAWRVINYYDANSAVTQTVTTANANYEVLFSVTADNTTRTEGARKNSNLTFNPSTGTLTTKILMPNNTYDATWINCGKHPNIYINNTNAAPWITGNTKNGRIALCSYVGNDDKLYFNYWTNTTLAGTTNTVDKQMTWDASNGTLTTATFVGALTGHASSDLALSGGTMTGNINFPAGKSIYSKDSANRNYALIYDNGNNLWIGATSSSGNHHTGSEGSTYISAGYNTTNSKGNNTIYVSVPTLTGSTWSHTAYAVLHVGNTSFTQSLSSGTKIGTIKINGTSTDLYCQTNTNTHRPIQVDGTEVLGNNTTALNLVAGGNVSLSNDGGAVTITATDTNNAVAITNTNPTTGTWYYPVWHSSTSATSTGVRANDGFRYYSLQGTASAAGRSIIQVGNGTATGTAGNKYGEIRIYSQKQGSSTLTMAGEATADRKHTLPDVAGTIGVFTETPTSGQVVVSNGTAGGFRTTGYTIAKSVPSNAVFTDANVTQTEVSDSTYYEVCLSNSTSGSVKKSSNLQFLPSYGRLQITSSSASDTNIFSIFYTKDGSSNHLGFNVYGEGSCSCATLSTKDRVYAGEGIELGTASDSTVPFIDFHWNSTDTDYTARLIQRAENTIDFMGKNSSTWGTARAASFSSQSSIYVKENIYSITNDEAKRLLKLRPVVFDYKGDGLKNQRGLIAEEVLDVMPEMVIIPQGYTEYDPIEPWNTPCIDYSKFVPYLIKMVQIQQQEIDQLKEQIK